MQLRYALLAAIVFQLSAPAVQAQDTNINIIPQPVYIEHRPGSFLLSPFTKFEDKTGNAACAQTIALAAAEFSSLLGCQLNLKAVPAKNVIKVYLKTLSPGGSEAYQLSVQPDSVVIIAATATGVLYAFESLKQLLPADLAASGKDIFPITCCLVKDSPQYAYRAMHLDVSRHFFPPAFIKRYIDILASFKLNVFHWHLTDSHGWRLEIKQYPRLTSVGAWRADRTGIPMTLARPTQPGEKASYGGFYTQQEVKDIIAYAGQRNITVIPEIEMPGHCTAAIVAYPEYGDLNNPVPLLMPCGYEGDLKHNFCAGYDSTYVFIENILKEVIEIFPSKYIHIGGDEVRPESWLSCPRCRKKMKENGWTTAKQLQAYFTERIDSFITAHGKVMMGWDEIVEAQIAKTSVNLSWHGESKATEAAGKGNHTVMTPYRYTYFDFYQSDAQLEPDISYARLQLDTVYRFNPMPASFTGAMQQYILGGEACLWTENITTPERVEYMLLPRLLALSEALWTPAAEKDYQRFVIKTEWQFRRFDKLGIHHAKSMYNVNMMPAFDAASKTVRVTLANQTYQYAVHYTTNGATPSVLSPLYSKPVVVSYSCIIKAATFNKGKLLGKVNTDTIVMHKGIGAVLTTYPYNENAERLADGILGTIEPYDHRWVMLEDSLITIVADCKKIQRFHSFSTRFMEDQVGYLYLPKAVAVSTSLDGVTYTAAFTIINSGDAGLPRRVVTCSHPMVQQARFIKVQIHNPLYNKIAHQNNIMMDEIIVQ